MASCHSIAILCDLRLAAQSRDSRARAMAHTTRQTLGSAYEMRVKTTLSSRSAVDHWPPHVGVRNAAPQLAAAAAAVAEFL